MVNGRRKKSDNVCSRLSGPHFDPEYQGRFIGISRVEKVFTHALAQMTESRNKPLCSDGNNVNHRIGNLGVRFGVAFDFESRPPVVRCSCGGLVRWWLSS